MECQPIPAITYGEFGERFFEKAIRSRIPLNGSIEVTARCNLRCAHCYINLPAGDSEALGRELSTSELRTLIEQIADEGCLWLLLTGGEPLVRPDLLDIHTHAMRRGLLITLFTNGTLITPTVADHLAEWRPFAVEVTLYGVTRGTYERVTGIPGSFERCMRGIELLLERRLPLKLKSVIMTLNRQEICDMKAYAEGLGVPYRYDAMLNMRADGGRRPAEFRISPEDAVSLDLADEKRMEQWYRFCDKFWGPPPEPEHLYQCGAGDREFHVDSFGQLSPCLMARAHRYDLRKGTFRNGWHDFMPEVKALRWSREVSCRGCELIALCGQCPGWAHMENGDEASRVEYLCRIAHMRADAFGLHTTRTGGNHDEKECRYDASTLSETSA